MDSALIEVLVGAFIMFTLARTTYTQLIEKSGWLWVSFVSFLAIINMAIHRLILENSINPPFFTAALFIITICGLHEENSKLLSPWHKRGIYGIIIGTLTGWALYIESGKAL